jgi:hypothetical protein
MLIYFAVPSGTTRAMAKSRTISPEERERTLRAIEAAIPSQARLVPLPSSFAASESGDELYVWAYAGEPSQLAVGEVYATVVVRFTPGREPHVAQFRSRRRPDGDDDTVP